MFFANVKYKELVTRRKPCMCLNVCSVSAVSLYGAALGPQLATPSTKRFPDTFECCRRTVGSPLCLKKEIVMTRKGHNDICSENIICKICNIKNMLSTFLRVWMTVPFSSFHCTSYEGHRERWDTRSAVAVWHENGPRRNPHEPTATRFLPAISTNVTTYCARIALSIGSLSVSLWKHNPTSIKCPDSRQLQILMNCRDILLTECWVKKSHCSDSTSDLALESPGSKRTAEPLGTFKRRP